MIQNINLNILKYFYEVAQIKNITQASKKLNISQPALTKAIKELETELNTTLLIRNNKGITLTKEGKILYEYSKTMFQKLQTTIKTINKKLILLVYDHLKSIIFEPSFLLNDEVDMVLPNRLFLHLLVLIQLLSQLHQYDEVLLRQQ